MSAPNRSFAMPKFASTLEFRMLGLAVVLAVILSFISPHFFTERNMFNILDQSVVLGIVAVGMTLVILTGGIDLSVGSVAGLTGIVLALLLKEFPIPVAIVLAIGCGALIGLFSGVLIAVFGLAPFVVTLGVMAMGRSLAVSRAAETDRRVALSVADVHGQAVSTTHALSAFRKGIGAQAANVQAI